MFTSTSRRGLLAGALVAVAVGSLWLVPRDAEVRTPVSVVRGEVRGEGPAPADPTTLDTRLGPVSAVVSERRPSDANREGGGRSRIESVPEDADAEALVRSGRVLVSENSGDAVGNDRFALETGIARIERALTLGNIDRKRAYMLLAQAYNALHTRTDASREEALAFLRKEGVAYRELARLEPTEPEWLMSYAGTLTEPSDLIEELYRIVDRFPEYLPARKALAFRLCDAGRKSEGMEQAVRAADALRPSDYEEHASGIVGIGFGCMREAGAERIAAIVERRRKSTRDGIDRPRP